MNINTITTEHYLPEKTKRRRANTVAGYESSLTLHVLPRWGSLEINEIEPDDIQDWGNIIWRTGLVPIKGMLQEVRGQLYEYAPKTPKGERDGFLPAWALDRLHQIWVERGRPKGRIIGDRKPSSVSASIQRWIKRMKLPRITMENLRHTWGTIAANANVPIATVAAMMGHSNIQTTYRYYYALSSAVAKRAQRKVARSVLGKTCDDMYKGIIVKADFAVAA